MGQELEVLDWNPPGGGADLHHTPPEMRIGENLGAHVENNVDVVSRPKGCC